MAFFFRKSINIGPIRINFSKSGMGFSIGVPGARVGKSATGKTFVSGSAPGTGIGYRKYLGTKKSGK
ncbi:DUF4236 domain-containing protein [Pontibacter sp. BAB1700]|uniref:DUF4236 domain-containing protein n=1 Tax=Pontibacter sp. BAB1700 TaxID=1144253 RepID=UPI00026BD28E|nr:DUF4236 domain-containing protein [Pontibacter sp. BAB1700]EJF08500.1 hypothetical protein O71_20372 [Pontibacter sp. BAB1700]